MIDPDKQYTISLKDFRSFVFEECEALEMEGEERFDFIASKMPIPYADAIQFVRQLLDDDIMTG